MSADLIRKKQPKGLGFLMISFGVLKKSMRIGFNRKKDNIQYDEQIGTVKDPFFNDAKPFTDRIKL